MPRPSLLLAAFVLAVLVFGVTHFMPIPGGLVELRAAIEGKPILDLSPSFTSDEVYARLEAFGETGRALYQRFTVSTDVVFPLTVATFLFLLARFAGGLIGAGSALRIASALPLLWFAIDMTENASIFAMLSAYPERLDTIGANVGYVTVAKRAALFAAVAIPAAMLAVAGWRRFVAPRFV
jgi:hypothetical protein